MRIDIWSDTACPYCYIGLKKLQNELATFEHKANVKLEWHSYELNEGLSLDNTPASFIDYLVSEHGSTRAEEQQGLDKLVEAGKELGINFDFDNLVMANTSKALRLVKLSKKYDLATETELALFAAYFEDGKNVSDDATLICLAERVGLPKDKVEAMLASDEYAKEVKADTAYGDDVLDLNFIPYFVFNNEHVVQGAIKAEEYSKLLSQSYREWLNRGEGDRSQDVISGQSCSIDGVCS